MEREFKSVTAVHSRTEYKSQSGLYHLVVTYLEYVKWENPNALKLCLEKDWTDDLCMKCRSAEVTNALYIVESINCFAICCGL